MANKNSTKSLLISDKPTSTDNSVKIALFSLLGVILVAFLNGVFGNGAFISSIFPTTTPNATVAPTLTATPTIPGPYIVVTDIALETQTAEQRSTAIALLTQSVGATATQQYMAVLQTVQANMEATRIYEQAQQQVATEQARNAEATAQVIIAIQQTTTAFADKQNKEQIFSLNEKLSDFPIMLSDMFEDDSNGWSPKTGLGYDISIQNGVLQVNVSESKRLPFLWTCDACDKFDNFSYQIDIQTPKGEKGVVAGIIFGSPTRFDKQPFKEAYALSLYSTGAIFLQRISATGMDTVQLWDKRQDLLTPDGKFHTLQVIVSNKYAIVYVDGKVVGDVISLEHSPSGYIGLIIQTTDVNILYDNMKIVKLP
jgi:hypothetical protein